MKTVRFLSFYRRGATRVPSLSPAARTHAHIARTFSPPPHRSYVRGVPSLLSPLVLERNGPVRYNAVDTALADAANIRGGKLHGLHTYLYGLLGENIKLSG